MKKFIGWLVIFMMLLALAGCNLGLDVDTEPGDVPESPEDSKIEINLISNGDFEAMDENGNGAQFGWGTAEVKVKNIDGNKVLSINGGSGAAEWTTYQDFSASAGVFSAKVKLANEEDASKVTLIVEMFDDENAVTEERVFKSDSALAETTDWQNLSLNIAANSLSPFKTKFKIEVSSAVGEVLIDDMKFIPDDALKINFIPFGDFEGDGKFGEEQFKFDKKWVVPTEGWSEVKTEMIDGDNAIVVNAAESEIITFINWICPDTGVMFPAEKKASLSFYAKGPEGTSVSAIAELKPESGDAVIIQQNFNLEGEDWNEFNLLIDTASIQYKEFGIHFKTSGGSSSDKVYIDDASINIVKE